MITNMDPNFQNFGELFPGILSPVSHAVANNQEVPPRNNIQLDDESFREPALIEVRT